MGMVEKAIFFLFNFNIPQCQVYCIDNTYYLVHCWWECRLVRPLWKTVWDFLRKLKMELPFDPAIPLLGLDPKNPETQIHKNLFTPMFIAAQFTIAKYWIQPKCPSTNEWIKKLCTFTQWNAIQQKERRSLYPS